ncbi:translation initiation factor Sui1 [Paludibacterium paludis]|uniref:Translation initiation factor n=1 Tax=Paludibacterium paludis TaxID=1225769 RepID=A0A918P3S9_9NEIS|nr:translation initiation factor Sui1 [Paludibacterium paludis]GGY17258.1 translation initiation factor [Paludibacterium paludis]
MKPRSGTGGLVYSTEFGRMCPVCRESVETCRCAEEVRPAGDGVARISREKSGRGGKEVTVIRGLALTQSELNLLAKSLKQACGTGGTAKDGAIEIQGDRRETVARELEKRGFTVRQAGG